MLPFSGKLITFEIGLRFLTDFLAGDTYFKVHRDGHNLDRCRTQFKLVESIEQQETTMNKLWQRFEKPRMDTDKHGFRDANFTSFCGVSFGENHAGLFIRVHSCPSVVK